MNTRLPPDSSHALGALDMKPGAVERLQSLREKFFTPHPQGLADYWDSHETLAAYDATLARRIAWKWDAVVDAIEAQRSFVYAPFLSLLDWGCGSGAAVTTVLKQAQPSTGSPLPGGGSSRLHVDNCKVVLHDRSPRAMTFAKERVNAQGMNQVETTSSPEAHIDKETLLLVSHVLTELGAHDLSHLTALASKAGGILWVEPGTPFCGERLVELREAFRSQGFVPVLPCPHSGRCGLAGRSGLAGRTGHSAAPDAQQRDWCHLFAEPPREVFQNGEWARLAKALKVDLRSLPVSFLFLVSGERVKRQSLVSAPLPSAEALVLGRPKGLKGHTQLVLCSEESVQTLDWQHKHDRALAKTLEKPDFLRRFPLPK
ncbi:MAG: hypothetical protein IOD12_13465 [Silvanigrellales bacterium]|jgi:hypothetical protein|nr:hypothetical protein [Silvanigrellales bacterium]